MPQRVLKPEVRDSDTINGLSDAAEALWYRLLVTVDDFGRFDARPVLIKAQCYPIKESVTPERCNELLAELDASGVILVYRVEGKPFLQMARWDNVPRAKSSRYPAVPEVIDRVYADARTPQASARTPAPPAPPPPAPAAKVKAIKADEPPGFVLFWREYPGFRKGSKKQCLAIWRDKKLEAISAQILAHVAACKSSPDWLKDGGKFIPAPLVYLRNDRWDGADTAAAPASTSPLWGGETI